MEQTKMENGSHPQDTVSVNSLPAFLTEVKDAINAGDMPKAESILCDKTVEQLNLTNEKYFLLQSEVSFTPVMKNNWVFMGAPSESINMTTE